MHLSNLSFVANTRCEPCLELFVSWAVWCYMTTLMHTSFRCSCIGAYFQLHVEPYHSLTVRRTQWICFRYIVVFTQQNKFDYDSSEGRMVSAWRLLGEFWLNRVPNTPKCVIYFYVMSWIYILIRAISALTFLLILGFSSLNQFVKGHFVRGFPNLKIDWGYHEFRQSRTWGKKKKMYPGPKHPITV